MDKNFDPKSVEESIYQMWETGGYFKPQIDSGKKPFSILLPPPNANADLHVGHAMYVIEDIMVRFHRM
ncbi:MAG: class I tRNA ligase family protein, partial [Patescibacteria group bacterium]